VTTPRQTPEPEPPATARVVALADQRDWRDLRLLAQRPDDTWPEARWLDPQAAAAAAPEPLMACGLWACRDPAAASLLHRRSAAGLASLLVARFEPRDLAPVIGAPATVRIAPGELDALHWQDGRVDRVPAVTVIDSPLPQGQWARGSAQHGAATGVLAFRPHTGAGLILLCTATVTARALGVRPEHQRELLRHLLAEMARRTPAAGQSRGDAAGPPAGRSADPTDYLARHGADGALVLLAAALAPQGPVDADALRAIGAALPAARLAALTADLPPDLTDTPAAWAPDAIAQALRAAGWGAHLRALARRTEAE
jgi:hypothetical protein